MTKLRRHLHGLGADPMDVARNTAEAQRAPLPAGWANADVDAVLAGNFHRVAQNTWRA